MVSFDISQLRSKIGVISPESLAQQFFSFLNNGRDIDSCQDFFVFFSKTKDGDYTLPYFEKFYSSLLKFIFKTKGNDAVKIFDLLKCINDFIKESYPDIDTYYNSIIFQDVLLDFYINNECQDELIEFFRHRRTLNYMIEDGYWTHAFHLIIHLSLNVMENHLVDEVTEEQYHYRLEFGKQAIKTCLDQLDDDYVSKTILPRLNCCNYNTNIVIDDFSFN